MENTNEVAPEVIENGHRTVSHVDPSVPEEAPIETPAPAEAVAPEEVVDAPAEGNDAPADAPAEGSEVING